MRRADLHRLNLTTHQRATTPFGVVVAAVAALALCSGPAKVEDTLLTWAVLVMGVVLATYRQRLLVDVGTGITRWRVGCIVPYTKRRVDTRTFKRLTLRERTVGKRKRKRTVYELAAGRSTTICQLSDPTRARYVAETAARALGLPLDNRVYGVSSLRRPDELDRPVAQRWQAAGERKEPPARPPRSRLRVDRTGDRVRISTAAEHHNLKFVALLALASAAFTALVYGFVRPFDRWIVHIFFGVYWMLLAAGALAFAGRSSVVLTGRRVKARQGMFPLAQSIALAEIEEFIVGPDGIYLVGDRRAVWLHWAGGREDSAYLRALLEYEIQRLSLRPDPQRAARGRARGGEV